MHDPLRRKGFFMQEVYGVVATPGPEEWDSSVYMRSNGAEEGAEMADGGGGKGEGSGSSSEEGREEAPGPECVVYVRGFQGAVADEATIKQRLRECFGDNGEVARIQLPCNRETGLLKVHTCHPLMHPSTHMHPTAAWAGCVLQRGVAHGFDARESCSGQRATCVSVRAEHLRGRRWCVCGCSRVRSSSRACR